MKFPEYDIIKYYHDLGINQDYYWYLKNGNLTQEQYNELTSLITTTNN